MFFSLRTDPKKTKFSTKAIVGCNMANASEKEMVNWWQSIGKKEIKAKLNACRNDSMMNMKWDLWHECKSDCSVVFMC